jgi:hypothetical protein
VRRGDSQRVYLVLLDWVQCLQHASGSSAGIYAQAAKVQALHQAHRCAVVVALVECCMESCAYCMSWAQWGPGTPPIDILQKPAQ